MPECLELFPARGVYNCGMLVRDRWQLVFLLAAPAAIVCLVAAAPNPLRLRPRGAPATAPAPAEPGKPPGPAMSGTPPAGKYPDARLTAACRRAAETLRGRLDKTFAVKVATPFVIAGDVSPRSLDRYAGGTVLAPAEALWKGYFRKKPDKVITVLLFADEKSYKLWARKLFNDTSLPHFGYYKPDKRTMVMNIATGGGTLVHELTHSLVVYDFPNLPTWFDEGFASLHEGCHIGRDTIIGLPNWRLPSLQKAVRGKTLRSLRDLITKRDFRGPLEGLNYAQARYFVMYMQKQKLLKKFYRHLRGVYTAPRAKPTPQTDVQAVEHVFGKKLEDVEKDFLKWVMTVRYR